MTWIVRRIIYGYHTAHLVKILDKHAFLVKIGYTHWPLYLCHPTLGSPCHHRIYQGRRHPQVVDKLYHAESYGFEMPSLVGVTVDDSGNTANTLSTGIISHKGLDVGKFKSGILLWIKGGAHVAVENGHIIRIAGIQTTWQSHKIVHSLSRISFLYYDFFHLRRLTSNIIIGCKIKK